MIGEICYGSVFQLFQFVWGEGENGKNIDDVILPPWALSPEHFVNLHKEVLSTDFSTEVLLVLLYR